MGVERPPEIEEYFLVRVCVFGSTSSSSEYVQEISIFFLP